MLVEAVVAATMASTIAAWTLSTARRTPAAAQSPWAISSMRLLCSGFVAEPGPNTTTAGSRAS